MSQVTERARIGTLVSCYGYRNSDLLADMARTVDHASGGRLVLGLGAGWLERDYLEYGYPMPSGPTRIGELEEAIVRLKRRLELLNPPPVGRLPLMVGGLGEKLTLAVCARHADLWNGWGTPDEIARLNGVLDEHCERAGRDPAEIERTVALFEPVSPDTCDDYAAAGAGHFILVRNGPDYRIDELAGLIEWRDSRQAEANGASR